MKAVFWLCGIILLIIILILYTKSRKKVKWTTRSVNEYSFQKYAKFYGNIVLTDTEFKNKINTIHNLITNKKMQDITEIAKLSNCTFEECILKIRYLKNKRQIGDYYIDHVNGLILPCTKEDQILLDKYKPYIYQNHYQIDEIATHLPGSTLSNKKQTEEQVLKDLIYLDEKDLINGIKINKVDQKIIYYTIEKHKKEKDYITINCPNCGAINDVNRGGKIRCEYCNTIIEDKNS